MVLLSTIVYIVLVGLATIYIAWEVGLFKLLFKDERKPLDSYEGSITEAEYFSGKRLSGQIERIVPINRNKLDPSESEAEIYVYNTDIPEKIKAKEIIAIDPFEAMAGRGTHWLIRGVVANELNTESMMKAETAISAKKTAELLLNRVSEDNKKLAAMNKDKLISDSRTLGVVKRVAGLSSGFGFPFGSSHYRRPYSSFGGGLGSMMSQGGGDEGGESDGGE